MTKRVKFSIYTLLFAAILSVFAALLFVMPHSVNSVYAATNTSEEMKTIGEVEKANGAFLFKGAPEEHYCVMMGSKNLSGTGELENYAILDWSYVIIKVDVKDIKEHRKFVLSKDGQAIEEKTLSGNESQILFEGSLADGNYEFVFSTEYYVEKTFYTISYYRFHFTIDCSAPQYIIQSEDGNLCNGDITSKQFVYSAIDSHFKRLYYKSPTASIYSTTADADYTVEPTSSNSGWWQFYAIDSLGQKNETVKVCLDCMPPQMTCSSSVKFGTTIGDSIKITATDEVSTAKLFARFENEEWLSYGNSCTIPETGRNGKYYFYAEDDNGNRSETNWIVLSTEDPTGSLIKSDFDNSVSFVWNNEYWSATLDGANYTEGTLISEEGQHEIVLSNNAYKTKSYTFNIEHYYKVVEHTDVTCSENGISKYECSQCGDTYEETQYASGHKYNITSTPQTCTDCERLVYICTVCGDRYDTEGNYPTGHSYISTVKKSPTCTVEGIRLNTCEKCGDSYETRITANGHNYQISDTSTKNGKTTRTYKCVDCGDSYKQELGDQYEVVANYIEYLFEQYSPYMWWVFLASAGIWSIAIGVSIAIAQKNEDKDKARKMLINYAVGLVVIAVIVVACPFLIRGIAALI